MTEHGVIRVVPGVYAIETNTVEGKCGVVIGERGALAIDTGNDPNEGRAIAGFIRDQGREPRRLALTHAHGDHILGGEPFRDAEILAHDAAPETILRHIAHWAEQAGVPVDEMAERIAWPTLTYTQAVRVSLGGKRVWLLHTPGHSEDSACAYVEEDAVLFGGDTAVTGIVPAIGDGRGDVLEATLRMLAELEIQALVPGHGPIMHGPHNIKEWLIGWAVYLARIRESAREALLRGEPAVSVVEGISFADFVGSRLPVTRHDMLRRHRDTVGKIIQEVMITEGLNP